MKKIFSLFAALVLAMGAFADTYTQVTTAPTDWSGEYAVGATLSSTSMAVFKGLDAASSCDTIAVANGQLATAPAATIIVEALANGGYSVKVSGGANNGKYIGSGTSAPTYANALKFLTSAQRVDFAMEANGTVKMSQSGDKDATLDSLVYFMYNSIAGNLRYRFYKQTNLTVSDFLLPILFKKEVEPACYDTLSFLGNGSGNAAYDNQIKVCAPAGVNVVNLQAPGFANGVAGIYIGMPAAPITACSLGAGNYTAEGAGILLHLSAITQKVTTVTVTANGVDYELTVYYANGTEATPVVPVDTTNTVHIANTAATAYTTAEIIKLIDDKKSILADSVFVKGVVGATKVSYSKSYKSITYYLDNDAFQVYSGRGLNNDSIQETPGADYIGLNDTVIAKGVVKLFTNSKTGAKTYEMDKNNYLVEIRKYVKPATDTTSTVHINNTLATAYTVEEALALLADKKSILEDTVYVYGVVDSVVSYNTSYGDITVLIGAGEKVLKLYALKNFNGGKFSSKSDLQKGDSVWVKGCMEVFKGENEISKGVMVDLNEKGYYIKHPFDGTNWDWAEMRDTVIMNYPASYYVGTWGGSGFNIAQNSKYYNASWYPEDLIGYADAEGNPGEGYKPTVGDKVVFGFLHEDVATVVGGGRAWVITGVFTALDANGAEVTCTKVLIDGKVYIIRGEHMYNANGAMVK